MPSFVKTLLSSLLMASALAAEPAVEVSTKTVKRDTENCDGVRFAGAWSEHPQATGCCVGGTVEPPYQSVCDGWPICKSSPTTTWSQPPFSCATIITDGPSYSELVSSADASIKASGTNYVTRLDGKPLATTAAAGQGSGSSTANPTSSGGANPKPSDGAASGWTAPIGLVGGVFMAAVAML